VSLPAGALDAQPVAGGDINEAWRVRMPDGTDAFVKTRAGADPLEFKTEAAGLRWLAEAGTLRVPRVLEIADGHLALEWIEPGVLSGAGEEELGRGLAGVHRAGAQAFAGEMRLGALRLPGEACTTWAEFYAQQRLLPLARRAGALDVIEPLCERLGVICGPAEAPARLHGDLWRGNVLAGQDGRPWLIDPAAYGGHREIDLAMYELFGGRSERMLGAYAEISPLADGYQERVALWQLLPLLVHAVLFGGSYVDSVRRGARRYL
jgi:fructosamine-3-kinase